MKPLWQTVQSTPGVGSAIVSADVTKVWLSVGGTHTGASVNVVAILDRRPDSLTAAANRIADALLTQHAARIDGRLLRIHVSYGRSRYRVWRSGYTDARTVPQWRAKLRGVP